MLHIPQPLPMLQLSPRWMVILVAERCTHTDLRGLEVALGGVLSHTSVWGQYRIHLLTERNCARSTISTWRGILFDFWDFCQQRRGHGWHQVIRADLTAFLKRPCQSGRRRGQPLSTAAAASKVVAICQFYEWCAVCDPPLLPKHRLPGVRPPKVRNGVPKSLPGDKLRDLLLAAEADPRLYLMCWLCYGGALRIGEVAALRIEDVYLYDPRPRMRVNGKGGKERWVHLHPEVRAALEWYLAGGAASGPLIGQRLHPDRPCKANTLSKELGSFITDVAGKGSAHWLRHTGATAALTAAKGRNLEEVRELLGHASDRTTRLYVSGYNWDVAAAVDGIPNPLAPG